MPSNSMQALAAAVEEVHHLLAVPPPATGTMAERLARPRVLGRAAVVLLSSHFERYFYSVNEEATAFLNSNQVPSESIPVELRLLHAAPFYERAVETQWLNREALLTAFVAEEAWLWAGGQTGAIRGERLLAWMKSPKPESLRRYFKYWGVNDIFGRVTRTSSTRARMFLLVQELVDKRNNIAHGDTAAQATKVDVQRYARTVTQFCGRADRVLSSRISQQFGTPRPW